VLLSSRFAAARQLLASGSASAGSVRYILEVRYYYCVVVLLRRFKESYTHSHRVLHHDIRTVMTTSKREHITPVLAELHWLPVAARIDFRIAVITFNLLTTEQPSYLCELL